MPAARRSDPKTSHDAASSVNDVTRSQQAVLAAFRNGGPMTDVRLHWHYERESTKKNWPHQSESGLRTRRSELVALGMLKDTGDRAKLKSGRLAIVWGLADAPAQEQSSLFEAPASDASRRPKMFDVD